MSYPSPRPKPMPNFFIPSRGKLLNLGEVVFGASMTGVKGYYSTVTIKSDSDNRSLPLELFAVSSDYVTSAY